MLQNNYEIIENNQRMKTIINIGSNTKKIQKK